MLLPSTKAVTTSNSKRTKKPITLNDRSQAGWTPFKHGRQVSSSNKVPGDSWSVSPRFDSRKPSYFHMRKDAKAIEMITQMAQSSTLQLNQ